MHLLDRLPAAGRNAVLLVGGVALGVGLVVGGSALTGDDEQGGPAVPASRSGQLYDANALAEVEGPRARADSPEQAVELFLAAEQAGDRDTAFSYLADGVRLEYGSSAAWAAAHPDALAPVTGFALEPGSTPGTVTTTTRYASSLDPVAGLVPARAETRWAVVDEGGWAVDISSTTQQPLLPPDEQAVSAVQTWAGQQQQCAQPAVYSGGLRGQVRLAEQLCGSTGAPRATGVEALAQVDAPVLQSSFGADVSTWARTVPVDGPVPLRAVVAPVADEWVVVALLPPAGTR